MKKPQLEGFFIPSPPVNARPRLSETRSEPASVVSQVSKSRPGAPCTLFGFSDVTAKDEAEFKYAPELVRIRSCLAKDCARRVVGCMHHGEIAAKVQASLLVGRCRGESGAPAACSKAQQVDRSVGRTPRTREVFKARRKR